MKPRTKAVYLDNHATTRLDPRVLEAMRPWFLESYGNAASTGHVFGWDAKDAVDAARETVAAAIGARAREIVFTSGATESNNLALAGAAERAARGRNRIVSVVAEHPSVLEPLEKLRKRGFDVVLLPVRPAGDPEAGQIRLDQLETALCEPTLLVSVMAANNEIGTLAPLKVIGRLCRQRGVALHVDATQAVGKVPVDVDRWNCDLMSFSAHKIYGPKGVGALFVRRRGSAIRLEPQILGGGHEAGYRSGTLNVPGIVGFAKAVELCQAESESEAQRLRGLRDGLFAKLQATISGVSLNGPALLPPEWRLPGNLNVALEGIDGETLLLFMPDVALSSGAACTSNKPEPSHVLRALGLPDTVVRSSVRFGLGRFTTQHDLDIAVARLAETVARLRAMTST
jgi:cysteine desulfurase